MFAKNSSHARDDPRKTLSGKLTAGKNSCADLLQLGLESLKRKHAPGANTMEAPRESKLLLLGDKQCFGNYFCAWR
jgi:hypothetical protein